MSDSVQPHPWDSPGKNTGVGCHFLLQCIKVKSETEVTQSCLTLRDPMDCSLPGSSVHGIFQASVLEWDTIAFSSKQTDCLLLKYINRKKNFLITEHLYFYICQSCQYLAAWSIMICSDFLKLEFPLSLLNVPGFFQMP